MQWFVTASLVWSILGLMLALAAPRMGVAAVDAVAVGLTIAFLLVNLAVSARLLARRGRPLTVWPLTAVQFVLFTLLFFQIACHLGAEHYHWERLPRWWHWPWFAAAHALRAADLFDVLEAFGFKLQNIEHASHLTSVALILFQLYMSLFLISVLLEAGDLLRRKVLSGTRRRARLLRLLLWGLAGLFVAVWLASALAIRPWRRIDLLLWPVDNLLRVADFMDVMEVYKVRLHAVPNLWWEATLTALCRVFLGLLLGGVLGWMAHELSIRWVGGWGLSDAELSQIASSNPEKRVRIAAQKSLARRAAARAEAERRRAGLFGEWGVVFPLLVVMVVAAFVLLLLPGWPNWDAAAARLANTAVQPPGSQRALAALRRMGPYAESVIPTLAQSLPGLPPESRQDVVHTLGFLGPAAVEPLHATVTTGDEQAAVAAVTGLRRIGPPATESLLSIALEGRHARARQAAREGLRQGEDKLVQRLLDTLAPQNAHVHLELLEELGVAWHSRTSANPYFSRVCQARAQVAVLRNLNSRQDQVLAAIRELGDVGPGAAAAVPALLDIVANREGPVCLAALEAVGKIGAGPGSAARDIGNYAGMGNRAGRAAALDCLGKMGPRAADAVTSLVYNLSGENRAGALDALAKIGPDAIPTLIDMLQRLPDENVAEVLGRLGPEAAASAVPVLLWWLRKEINSPGFGVSFAKLIRKVGPEAAPHLRKALEEPDPRIRGHVEAALSALVLSPPGPQEGPRRP